MKLLLDEMWTAAIAESLRQRGHDVIAIVELGGLRGQADAAVFAYAREEQRAIVTENVADFRALALEALTTGRGHCGIVFTSGRTFPRGDPRTPGRMVRALEALLEMALSQDSLEWWLSPEAG